MHKTLFALALAAAAQSALAGPLVYDVSQLIRTGSTQVSVVGFITTDGTIGTLGANDIVDFDLLLQDNDGNSLTLTPADGSVVQIARGGIVASSSNIAAFATADQGDIQFSDALETSEFGIDTFQGVEVGLIAGGDSADALVTLPFVFATIAPAVTSDVPEPAPLSLAGLGLVALATARRKSRARRRFAVR